VDKLQVFFQWWAPLLVHHLPYHKHLACLEQVTTLPSIQMLATPFKPGFFFQILQEDPLGSISNIN
jgi:hypothetical protein